jgi:hypothetical protein
MTVQRELTQLTNDASATKRNAEITKLVLNVS